MKIKSISPSGVKITNADEGKVTAVFATLNVKDSDGDVTLPGAFTEGEAVRVSQYNHASWKAGNLPVGKGVIRTEGDLAYADLEFFLDTTAGKDTFEVIKQMGAELQEWSYGFDTLKSKPGTLAGEKVNFLQKQKVHEVSPVILGAGEGTHTVSAKGAKELSSDLSSRLSESGTERFGGVQTYVYLVDYDPDESFAIFEICERESYSLVQVSYSLDPDQNVTLGDDDMEVERTTDFRPKAKGDLKFTEHIAAVVADVKVLTDRASDVMAMRQEKGKSISQESRDALADLEPALKALDEVLTSEPDNANDQVALLAQVERGRQLLRR